MSAGSSPSWAGVVHTGFAVADLDRSVAWYTEVLGLELIGRQRSESAYITQIVDMTDAVLDIAFLGFPAAPGPAGRCSS